MSTKNKDSLRTDMLAEGVMQGKSLAKAARDAGFSDSYARSNVYKEQAKASIQERIQQRLRDSQIDTNEIVGTLVSHMRADLADIMPDDEFLAAAKARGVSHLIKEIETTKRIFPAEVDESGEVVEPEQIEIKHKIKIVDSQAASEKLCRVFGLEKLAAPNPATELRLQKAVDRFIDKAAARGLTVTAEQAREKLMPFFESKAVN